MIRITDTYYIANEGKQFSRLDNNMLMGNEIHLGMLFRDMNGTVLPEPIKDNINNYVEIDVLLEEQEPVEELVVVEPESEIPIQDCLPETLAEARVQKIKELMRYDTSASVNRFYVQEYPLWFNESRRTSLHLAILAAQANGDENVIFICDAFEMKLPIVDALNIILAVHGYASNCFVITQKHKSSIELLSTIEEVMDYDFTVGYPDKLYFNL